MSWRISFPIVVGIAMASAPCLFPLTAAEPDAVALQSSLEQGAQRFAEAFTKQDAQAIAAMFTPEAEYVDASGTVFHGREAIRAEFAANFAANPSGKLDIEIISIRPIADGVVVEDGVSTFRPAQEGPADQMPYTVTHVRQGDGSWLMASVRELAEPTATAHERLKSLGWLEGRWREETAGSVVDSEWKWSDDGSFLIAKFSRRAPGEPAMSGTHRVGWDAERKQFRSWIFDSAGGSADGWWSPGEDGSWSVQLSGVDAEGSRQSTVLNYRRDGEAIVISQTERTRGGVGLPSITSRVVRPPAESGKQASNP